MNNKPRSLYIHIPFCEKLCDYCDFTKLQYFRKFAIPYLDALEKELKSYEIKELDTIYIGGGTPTVLEDDLFEKLLIIVYPYTKTVKEYTIEANPESLSESKIKLLKPYGVNRISIGVQSTDDRILEMVNRHHTFNQVKEAIRLLKEYNLLNINIDLILGLPHSSKAILKKDLENIVNLDVKHISCYALTIHPHTVLYSKDYELINDDQMRELYDFAHGFLKEKGFEHYEVSNWAKHSYYSSHNLTYWRNEQYYGLGLGASGYIDNIRYKNTINLDRYLNGEYIAEKEKLTKKDKYTYEVMLTLRSTQAGLIMPLVLEKYGVNLHKKWHEIKALIDAGYLVHDRNELFPTYEGMMILDQIILKLI